MSQVGINLETSLGYLLKEASSALHTSMAEVLRPLGMTITHYSCLELLSQRPGLSNSELARGAFVTRQSMNVLLHSLERDGIVTRPERPKSGRVLPTALTPKGRSQLATASAAVKAVEDRMKVGLSTEEQSDLGDMLARCISSLLAGENRGADELSAPPGTSMP